MPGNKAPFSSYTALDYSLNGIVRAKCLALVQSSYTSAELEDEKTMHTEGIKYALLASPEAFPTLILLSNKHTYFEDTLLSFLLHTDKSFLTH